MSWEPLAIEIFVEAQLTNKLGQAGASLWSRYVTTRDDVLKQVLPWIQGQAPGLTDHGPEHIRDVMSRATEVLGFKNEYGSEGSWELPLEFDIHEMFLLLCGILFHDVGNIQGRDRHNLKIDEVWHTLSSWHLWDRLDRKAIVTVGRAHSGKSPTGDKDTLKQLSTAPHYFLKRPVKMAAIAAVIRFADELAEGSQRTSQYLISSDLVVADSRIYHIYAKSTSVTIDRTGGRIALSYNIDVEDKDFGETETSRKNEVKKLIKFIYIRVCKLNHERKFTKHYSSSLSPFRETSFAIQFYKGYNSLELDISAVSLNDFSDDAVPDNFIKQIDARYDIDNLIMLAFGSGMDGAGK